MLTGLPSSMVYFCFRHHSPGKVSGDWTKVLFKNGAVVSQVITITETSTPGLYGGSFGTDATDPAYYHLTAHLTDDLSESFEQDWFVKSLSDSGPSASAIADAVMDEALSGHQVVGTLGGVLKLLKAWAGNKIIVTAAGDYSVYEDDGETIFCSGTITDLTRIPDES